MEIRETLKSQYHAGLWMLNQAVDRCPESVWLEGSPPRTYWRIAFHATFYTHWYLMPKASDLVRWEKDLDQMAALWQPPVHDLVYTRKDILEYIHLVDGLVDDAVDKLDLTKPTCGFSWYPGVSKLEHQLINLRHLQQHAGQLSELLMAQGIETDWRGKAKNN